MEIPPRGDEPEPVELDTKIPAKDLPTFRTTADGKTKAPTEKNRLLKLREAMLFEDSQRERDRARQAMIDKAADPEMGCCSEAAIFTDYMAEWEECDLTDDDCCKNHNLFCAFRDAVLAEQRKSA